ncbi:MAG: TIGR00266 family protein [Brevinematia bacterium]
MKYEILGSSFASYLKITLNVGETIYAVPGSFVFLNGEVDIEATGQGLFNAIKRKVAGGKNFFFVKYTAKKENTTLILAPDSHGMIIPIPVKAIPVVIQDKCYFAHTSGLKISTTFVGVRGLLTQSGFMWLKAEPDMGGEGIVFVSSAGEIEKIAIEDNEVKVDPKHIVCYSAYLDIGLAKFGGISSFLFGKEGLIFSIKGKGNLWLQTRSHLDFENKNLQEKQV